MSPCDSCSPVTHLSYKTAPPKIIMERVDFYYAYARFTRQRYVDTIVAPRTKDNTTHGARLRERY